VADAVLGPLDGAGVGEDVPQEGDGGPTGRGRLGVHRVLCGGGLRLAVTESRGVVEVRCLKCARVWRVEGGMVGLWTLEMFFGHERVVFARGAGRSDG